MALHFEDIQDNFILLYILEIFIDIVNVVKLGTCLELFRGQQEHCITLLGL